MKKSIFKIVLLLFSILLNSCTLTISLTKQKQTPVVKTEKIKKPEKVYTIYYGDRFSGLKSKEIKL